MTKLRRDYSKKTLKILFALSRNQCAHPECTNNVIEPSTGSSDAAVIAQICHIYAVSTEGPRGKAGLTNKELNSPENLILLCPNHHTVVDKQFETYPAELLKQWKQDHEYKAVEDQLPTSLDDVPSNVFSRSDFPTELIDQKIKDEIEILRKSRFFAEFDRAGTSLVLARKLVEGELSGGTNKVKRQALAWCVRILAHADELGKAEKYLKYSKKLGTCQEVDIADASISSQKGDKKAALSILAKIDSPMSRSASFMIVKQHDGPQRAIDWLKSADIDASNLDSDGKFSLLNEQLELADWATAQKCLGVLTDDDLHETPVLHHVIAMTHLLNTVPDELRSIVLNQLPFRAAHFPLSSDETAIKARRTARQHFIKVAEIASQLNLPHAATIGNEYALWLELMDPDESDTGRKRLESKLRDLKSALHFVRLGIEFGIKLDLDAVKKEIERQIALNGGITPDAALARFALTLTQKTLGDAANYIAQHHDELAGHIDKKTMLSLQIDLFSQTGQLEKANECLSILSEEGLSEAEKSRLQIMIAEAEETASVEAFKEQFKKTDSLSDLGILVDKLETRNDWKDICEYGKILFERTHYSRDAERLAIALHNTQKSEQLVEFLESNRALLPKSKRLQLIHCWSLYHEGDLLEARAKLERLDDDWDDENYRILQVYLAVSLGDWNSLSEFVAKECKEKDKRSVQELIYAARLALRLDSIHHAKELIFAAAEKGKDDADVLGAAYFLAASAGLEGNLQVSQWIQQAAALSDDDGPIWRMSLKEIWDQRQEWERRESEIWEKLGRGELPMFLAAHSLNRSLSYQMLFPALANRSESDPRQRGIVPAYSGQRQPLSLDTGRQVGIDATALLTLSFLDLLDEALDAFDMVHIPHSTLGWLFDEKWRVAFHQPSRIRDAHQIHSLLVAGKLKRFSRSTRPDSGLSEQVGEELASLIEEAEKGRDGEDSQRIVVQPFPVHRVGSLMDEEADLTAHTNVLSSCQSIVDKLWEKGLLIESEKKKVRAYLKLHEKPWPNQPKIDDGAVLYLSDVAVTYFLHLGILGKLKDADFKSVVSPRVVSETNQLISYEDISGEAKSLIENIQSAVSSRIESRRIKVGRRNNADQLADQSISEHPTANLLHLATYCDAIITDDRSLNQYTNLGDGDISKPIFSTLDIIDGLVKMTEEWMEYRTRLRQAGYFFVPVREDELAHHLNASMIKDGKVVEIAELKAIRENLLCVRMRTWLQLPKEAPWLNTSLIAFIQVMKSSWKPDANFSDVQARSNWIIDQIDIRGWAHRFGKEIGDNIVKTERGAFLQLMLTPPINVPREIQDKYWGWIEERVLVPIKEQYPDLYSWIVEGQRKLVAKIINMDIAEGKAT